MVYTINPGGGVAPFKYRVNQAWNSEQWVTIGTFAMENGGNVVLTNQSSSVDTTGTAYYNYDVAFDAIAFVPMGGTPGQPIGGPPGILDAPEGSNPAWVNCGCVARTAGDPVDTATGYFGQTWTDLETPGRGQPLDFTRTYAGGIADPAGPNGADASDGPFGWGWTYSYNLSTSTDPTTGNVTVRQEDGSQVVFVDSSGTYAPEVPRYDATLSKNGANYTFTRRGQDVFTFDAASGRLIAETDLAGSKASPAYQTTLAYNGAGQLSTITDPAGRVYALTWTGSHITELADSAGRIVNYSYDSSDDLTDVYGVGTTRSPSILDNDHMQYGYNTPSHLMTSMRSPDNYSGTASAVTSMTYDSAERVATQTDAAGNTTTFTYGPNGGLATGQTLVTDPSGHKTLDTYANGLLTSETKGYGTANAGTTSYTYDPVTLGVTSETDADGNLTTYSYDDHGNEISESNGLGYTTNYVYDASDNRIETIDPNGVATVNQYDQSGRIPSGAAGVDDLTSTTVTQANNVVESTTGNFGPAPTRTTNYYYDNAADPADQTRVVDADGNTTTTTYDAYGDKASSTDALGNKTQYGYDTQKGFLTTAVSPSGTAAGVTTSCTPPATGCVTYTHDAFGHVTSTTDPLGNVTKASFDADGNQTSATDANNETITTKYNLVDQPVQTIQADGTSQTVDYNPDGSVADTVDGLSDKTLYGYDGQGRLASTTNPDGRTTTSQLDPDGLTKTTTDPAGRTTTFGYDVAGQVASESYSDGVTPTATYSYDPVGRRVGMTDGTGTSTWTFDTFGEVTAQTQGSGAAVAYGYDNAGNETSITYPGQTTAVAQSYDADNRLKTVTDTAGNQTVFGYTADGSLQTTTYPDGTIVTNGYDHADQLNSTSAVTGSTTVFSASYSRDAAGQVATQTVNNTTNSVRYSPREELTTSTTGATTVGFAYDSANNPTTVGAATQTFDASGQLCWTMPTGTVTNPACGSTPSGATTYSFNSDGDRTASTPATGTASTYTYDQDDRLTNLTGPNGTASYGYDGDGLRASKTVGTTTTTFIWDNQAIPNLLSDGSTDYLYGPSGLPIEQTGPAGSFWYLHDQVGSTMGLLNSTGGVAGTYSYTTYGLASHSGSASTRQIQAVEASASRSSVNTSLGLRHS